MNDVGKTNFLYALRFVFDKDIRKQNFSDTDYYKKKVDVPIEIVIDNLILVIQRMPIVKNCVQN